MRVLIMICMFATLWLAMVLHAGSHRTCTFDGGGYLISGDAARTSDGHIWACADGQLYKIK